MDLQVTWGTAIVLIVLAAAHTTEEIVAEFRGVDAQRSAGDECSPAMERARFVVGRIGLFLLLGALAVSGVLVDAFWMWIGVGMIAAEVVKHATSSIHAQAYTPGLATSVACLAFVGWWLGQCLLYGLPDDPANWGAMVLGIAFVAINDLSAPRHAGATGWSAPGQASAGTPGLAEPPTLAQVGLTPRPQPRCSSPWLGSAAPSSTPREPSNPEPRLPSCPDGASPRP